MGDYMMCTPHEMLHIWGDQIMEDVMNRTWHVRGRGQMRISGGKTFWKTYENTNVDLKQDER